MKRSELERATIIDPGFSVADAEFPSISSSEDGLTIRFRDWREASVVAVFVDAISYRWDEIDWAFAEGERFDSSHVIENSDWMAEHLAKHAFSQDDGYKHYRLNFNVGGSLSSDSARHPNTDRTRRAMTAPASRSVSMIIPDPNPKPVIDGRPRW